MTFSMENAISETNSRRAIKNKYNEDNGITPKSIAGEIKLGLRAIIPDKTDNAPRLDLKRVPKSEF